MNESVLGAGTTLPPKSLRELRAKAHALKPVVWISQSGMSEGALREVDRALSSHELIKIHAAVDDRLGRAALLDFICNQLGAQAVQIIGKMLVAFRPRPEPDAKAQRASAPPRPRHSAKRAMRPGASERAIAARTRGKTRPKAKRTR